MKSWLGLACGVALLGAAPVHAGCWADEDVAATRVRELQTMLMVSTLRCKAAGIDITAAYNGFMTARRGLVESANLRIKRHFAASGGGEADYDRFTTTLANSYGGGDTTLEICNEAIEIAGDAMSSPARMALLAEQRVFPRALPGSACHAAVMTADSAAPRIIAVPTAGPAEMPAEIVTALVTLARFNSRPAVPARPVVEVAAVEFPSALAPGR